MTTTHQPYRERPPVERARYCLYCGCARGPSEQPCATCGAAQAAEDITPSLGEPLDCPRCRAPLQGESLDGAVVFRCATCFGCFVPERAWSMLMDRVSADAPAPMPGFVPLPPGRELPKSAMCEMVNCPLCGRAADRITFGARSGVVVDVCALHGTWFDAAELVRVKQFVRAREENGGVVPVSEEARREELDRERRAEEARLAARGAAARAAQREPTTGYRRANWLTILVELLRER